jgi:competence protein ComEC
MHEWLHRHPQVHHLDVARSEIDDHEGLTSPIIDPVGPCKASPVDPKIRALWSSDYGREEVGTNPNNESVVLRIDFGKGSMLLGGDLEMLAISRIIKKYAEAPRMLDADVYLVAHHGSHNSSSRDFVRRITPKVAVISAGPYDRHPGQEAGSDEPEFTAHQFGHPHMQSVDDLSDPEGGVSMRRDHPVDVLVGKRGAWKETPSEFVRRHIERAIYSTAWDGTVVVTLNANGWIEVKTAHEPPPIPAGVGEPAPATTTTTTPGSAVAPDGAHQLKQPEGGAHPTGDDKRERAPGP